MRPNKVGGGGWEAILVRWNRIDALLLRVDDEINRTTERWWDGSRQLGMIAGVSHHCMNS